MGSQNPSVVRKIDTHKVNPTLDIYSLSEVRRASVNGGCLESDQSEETVNTGLEEKASHGLSELEEGAESTHAGTNKGH